MTETTQTSMLNEAQIAIELGFTGRDSLLKTKRLLAKSRIGHFPQPDGSARVEAPDLAQYLRRGQPDRDPPRYSGAWFDNQGIAASARSFERRLRGAVGKLPEQRPAADIVNVRPSPAMRALISELMPESRALSRRYREDPLKSRMLRSSDAMLVLMLRRTTQGVIRRGGIKTSYGSSIEQLFASAAAYSKFTAEAIDLLFDGVLTTISKSYARTGHAGVTDNVVFAVRTRDLLTRADLDRAVSIAF